MHVSGGSILRKSQMCAVVQVGTQVELLLSLDSTLLSCLVPEQVISHQPLNPQLFFISVFSRTLFASNPIQCSDPPTHPARLWVRAWRVNNTPTKTQNQPIDRTTPVSCRGLLRCRFAQSFLSCFTRISPTWLLLAWGASSHSAAPHFCPTLLPHTFQE